MYSIRRPEPGEAVAVADVWLRSRHASYPAIPRPVHTDDEVREFFATVVLPTRDVWVAEVDGNLIGMLVLEDDWVDHLYLAPEWTGRGLGTQFIELAQQERPSGLQLWAFQSNERALRFYERHGFVPAETTDGDNEEGAPDVRYVWNLAP